MGVHLLTCKEVEDENADYKDENDWGSGGRELRPTIAGIVCIKAIDQSGQHCYNTREHFLTGSCLLPSPIVLVVVLVLGLWFQVRAVLGRKNRNRQNQPPDTAPAQKDVEVEDEFENEDD